jgi:hypothetical protein
LDTACSIRSGSTGRLRSAICTERSSLSRSNGTRRARVAGVVLFALGVACWFAREHGRDRLAGVWITTTLTYNVVVAAALAAAGIHYAPVGIALWPAVIVHCALAVWCAASLRQDRAAASG